MRTVWVSTAAFAGFEMVDVDSEDLYTANALSVGEEGIYPASFPRTRESLIKRGIKGTGYNQCLVISFGQDRFLDSSYKKRSW